MAQDYINRPVRAALILTNAFVAGTILENGNNYDQLIVLVQFTKGSLTSLEVKVEFSPDNVTFHQETFDSVSGGTNTLSLGEHTTTVSGNYRIAIPIKDRFIKISAKGTGTVTSSSATIDAVLGTTSEI